MLKILILDDEALKIRRIVQELEKIPTVEKDSITTVGDIINAKRMLKEHTYDILLIDIQIPNRFGQEPARDGGVRLLQEVVETRRYNKPIHIVGITAYQDIYEEFSSAFSDRLWSVVKCGDDSYNWASQIASKVRYISDLKDGLRAPMRTKYDFDLAVLTALDTIEFEGVLRLSQEWEKYEIANDNTNYYTCKFGSENLKVVAATAPEMGMTASAVLASKLAFNFCPRYLAMVGITAGIKEKVGIGDILVADPSWDYGCGKIDEEAGDIVFRPDPKQIRLEPDIRVKFEEVRNNRELLHSIRDRWPAEKPESELNVHIGPVGSGTSVLADQRIVDIIRKHNRNMIGLDMETYGVMYAGENAPRPRPIVFSMKSVCDFADSLKDDTYQKYAAYCSASLLFEFALLYLVS